MAHDTELGTREVRTGMTVLAVLSLALVWAAARKFLVPGAPTTAISVPAVKGPPHTSVESPVYVEAARPTLPWDGPPVNLRPPQVASNPPFNAANPVVPRTPPLARPAVPIPIPRFHPAAASAKQSPATAPRSTFPPGKIRDAPLDSAPPEIASPIEKTPGVISGVEAAPQANTEIPAAGPPIFAAPPTTPEIAPEVLSVFFPDEQAAEGELPPQEHTAIDVATAPTDSLPEETPSFAVPRPFPADKDLPELAAQVSAPAAASEPLQAWQPESDILPIRERLRLPGWITLVSADDIRTGRDYLVEEGDSLATIARYELGDSEMWPLVFVLNRHAIGDDPNRLRLGTWLKLPEVMNGDTTSHDRSLINARSDHIFRK